MHAFSSDELYSRRVSIKLLPYFSENIDLLVSQGNIRNKQRTDKERKSDNMKHIFWSKSAGVDFVVCDFFFFAF